MADQFARLADQHGAAQNQLTDRTLVLLSRLWGQVTNHADPAQLTVFARRAATVIRSAETGTGWLTEAYLRQVLRQLGIVVPAGTLVKMPGQLRVDVAMAAVLQRPSETVRYLESTGVAPVEAQARGGERLAVMAQMNVQLAQRLASRQVLVDLDKVTGWRRIIHPELSSTGVCGLCIAAADRIYKRGDLLPIHARCRCTVMPIVGALDPGKHINVVDLDQVYAAAGSNRAAQLKAVKFTVHEHGELGPILAVRGQQFRGVDDVAAA